MTSRSSSDPFIPTFLALALLALLIMISLGVSPNWQAAIPSISAWTTIIAAYGAWRVAKSWKPSRRLS